LASLADVASAKRKTDPLEARLIERFAQSKLYPDTSQLPITGTWSCLAISNDGCHLAVETDAPKDARAFIADTGDVIALDPVSLLYWAAARPDDATRTGLFTLAASGESYVHGQSQSAWLVSLGDKMPLKGDGIIKSDGTYIPVTIAGDLPGYQASGSLAATAPSILLKSIETIANHTPANEWQLDDLGTVEGGRRMLLVSSTDVILITSGTGDKPSVRSASITDIKGDTCAKVEGELEPWLRKVLTFDRV
jgi:hypothetical protein